MRTLAETVYVHDGPGWWPIIPIIFWLTIVGFVVFFARRRGAWARGAWGRGRGEAVLAERFANGDISEREYRERLDVLREKQS